MIAFDLIGNTPLVKLETFSDKNVSIYAKLEQYNPGGSVKDRLGKYLIEQALSRGQIKAGDTVVEASAGNTGIGLALAANHYGMRSVIYAPIGFAAEKMAIMEALGAQVIRTPQNGGMLGAQEAAKNYAAENGAFYTNQFETEDNPGAYRTTLAREILNELQRIDYFVAGAGSGGTFTGTAEGLAERNAKNILVEPEGSTLNGGPRHLHDTEGIGAEKWPVFLKRELVDEISTISDADAFKNVKHLALQEGLLVGSSSGAALQAALEMKDRLESGVIVTIFPDGSDRYMSKSIFNYPKK